MLNNSKGENVPGNDIKKDKVILFKAFKMQIRYVRIAHIDQTDQKKRQGEAADTHCLNTCFPNVLDFGRDQGNTFI